MAFKLSPEIEEKLRIAREIDEARERTFASLTNEQLADSARFWMQHCEAPRRAENAGPSTYDHTLWTIIVPEMMRRLRGG